MTVDTNLDSGDYQAALLFNDETNNFTVTRAVSAEIVTSVVLQDSQEIVSRQSLQPSGPAYDFIIDAHPITNAKFVAFLNDALNRPDELAGQYLYFDTDNGDVYMNDTQQGESGAGPDGRETHIFSPAVNTMVTWQGGAYEVNTDPQDFNDHPVTGVSWYGALKFCNWLTVDQGLFPEDRCYGEGTANQLSTWRPITISPEVWASRGMNDNERLQLVADCRGYRLPMDDGANNTSPGTDEADDYNEWYKAAAWNTSRNKNTDFGMGIDEGDQITGAHANFRCSNDPFENIDDCMEGGTTPVGFFDGTNLLSDGTPTIDTNNEFGLYDMSGNVFHWMQDQFEGDGEAVRAIRGGSYRWTEAQLITRMRAWKGADTPSVDLGFRVLRAVPATPGDIDGNLSVDLLDHNSLAGCLSGPDAVLPVEFCDTFDLATGLDGDVDLADFAVFQTSFDGN
ncbi:MAG: formylglycine-generating enzyme family protein [Phycisphaerae bacterium]